MFSKEKCQRLLRAKSMMPGAIKTTISPNSSLEIPLPPIDKIVDEMLNNLKQQNLDVELVAPEDANCIIHVICHCNFIKNNEICWPYVIRIYVKKFGQMRALDTNITYETYLAKVSALKKLGIYKDPYKGEYFVKIV